MVEACAVPTPATWPATKVQQALAAAHQAGHPLQAYQRTSAASALAHHLAPTVSILPSPRSSHDCPDWTSCTWPSSGPPSKRRPVHHRGASCRLHLLITQRSQVLRACAAPNPDFARLAHPFHQDNTAPGGWFYEVDTQPTLVFSAVSFSVPSCTCSSLSNGKQATPTRAGPFLVRRSYACITCTNRASRAWTW